MESVRFEQIQVLEEGENVYWVLHFPHIDLEVSEATEEGTIARRGKEPYDIQARDFDVCKLFGGGFCDGVEELAEWRARLAKTSNSEDFKLLKRSDEIHRGFSFLCCPDKICFARKGNQIHGFPP